MIWKCKDGREIQIQDMTDSHLINTIKMLRKKGYISARNLSFYLNCTPPTADGALMAFEAEQTKAISSEVFPGLDYLEKEAEKRKLRII